MTRYLRLRWLALILLLEAAVLLSLFSGDALINAVKAPLDPLAPQLREAHVRRVSVTMLPVEAVISTHIPAALAPVAQIKSAPDFKVLDGYSFSDLSDLKKWEEKIFKGGTEFKVMGEAGASFLKSKSENACSGLYIKVDYLPSPDLYVSWKWRAVSFPQKKQPEVIANKKEDDFAARIYVIFPGSNFFKSDVIEYIWDEHLPVGTVASSPYSERIKLYVLKSGPARADSGGWEFEERNVLEDYQKLYGKLPEKPVGAIALMSDSDNTETSAEADFTDIAIKTKLHKGG